MSATNVRQQIMRIVTEQLERFAFDNTGKTQDELIADALLAEMPQLTGGAPAGNESCDGTQSVAETPQPTPGLLTEAFLVTIKLPKRPEHNPKNKVTAPCAVSKRCTDETGEHHTTLVHTEGEVEQLRSQHHITRVETVERWSTGDGSPAQSLDADAQELIELAQFARGNHKRVAISPAAADRIARRLLTLPTSQQVKQRAHQFARDEYGLGPRAVDQRHAFERGVERALESLRGQDDAQ